MNTYHEYRLGDMLARYVTDEQGHIGLLNIHSRICLLFGEGYGVFFLPAERGSCVEIRYPLGAAVKQEKTSGAGR